MSFAFCFDKADENEVYHFAYSYPYTYTRLQSFLERIEKKQFNYFKRELLALTVVSCPFVYAHGRL